jgi:large subunit ribosomal protein L18
MTQKKSSFKLGRERRKVRTRSKIKGIGVRPRLSVFRSSKKTYAQLIDDEKGKTIAAASEKDLSTAKIDQKSLSGKTAKAFLVGQLLGQRALKAGIKKAVFDRGPFLYHGRIKALAEGARKAGLVF